MDALECIFTRRSVRSYTGQEVDNAQVETLLRAGMAAPSARNRQPWFFVVIRSHQLLDEIAAIHPFGKMLSQASLAIVVCGDDTIQPTEGYWVQDCSAATQNILLAANALGLGAVWLGVYPRSERIGPLVDLLSLPENIHPLCIISIGYPVESPPRADRYTPERVKIIS